MANVLFASNNKAHFPLVGISTNTAHFDNTKVPYAFEMPGSFNIYTPSFTPSAGEETWVHVRCYPRNSNIVNIPFITAYDDQEQTLFSLNARNTYGFDFISYLYDGNSSVNVNGNVPMTGNAINSIDIRYRAHALGIEMDVYVNKALCTSLSFASNPNGRGQPSKVRFTGAFSRYDSIYLSEILIQDDDTRNARLNLVRPVSAGAFNDWQNPLSYLADDNAESAMTTLAADQRQSMVMAGYNGLPNISNVALVSFTTRGKNSPTQLQHTLRQSGVNYDDPIFTVDFAEKYNITDHTLNPATSLPWTDTDLAALEAGFVSRA